MGCLVMVLVLLATMIGLAYPWVLMWIVIGLFSAVVLYMFYDAML